MAYDDGLVCNFKKCRKRLNNFAWTTSCSHVFCDEDGTKIFKDKAVCPVCCSDLPGQYDIVRVDLQPSDEYKSMLLAGQRPETIIEICSRALSFWTYQTHQERIYQEHIYGKLKDKLTQLEGYYQQLLSRTQAELSSVKALIQSQKYELESVKKKHSESTEKLLEKTRQYQKLQTMYDGLRRRSSSVALLDDTDDNTLPSLQSHSDIRPNHWRIMGRTQEDNLQVDPKLSAAVNVGAFHQNTAIHPKH